ncbi:MAG: tetratricopeptide repeat protein [Alkalispirochaeta sp.]
MRIPESRFSAAPRRRKGSGAVLIIVLSLLVALVAAVVVFLYRARTPIFPIADAEATEDIVELWNTGQYDGLLDEAEERLDEFPLDETALALRGFTRFYLAMQEVNEEQRQTLLNGTVVDLQRVLLLDEPEMEGEVHYVLGKAFFHRGRFFYDAAIEKLLIAREMGVHQLDLLEYLALASDELGRSSDAIAFFREAIEMGDEAVHKVNLADILIEEGRHDEAEELLDDTIEGTSDVVVLQHALDSLGRSYRRQERWEDALDAYRRLLEVNESSVRARFGLGETYLAMGENNLARYEWREAVRLDPNHIESLQRLQEY